jgi:small-conductance mechanosensitive channel
MRTFALLILLLSQAGSAVSQAIPAPPAPAQPQPPVQGSATPPVEAEVALYKDDDIAKRIRATYALLDPFKAVSVSVRAGVVELTGEVGNSNARQDAEQLARQVRGVVAVENNIGIERNIGRRLHAAYSDLVTMFYDTVAYLPLVAVAIALVLGFGSLGWLLGKWNWLFCRFSDNLFLRNVLKRIVRASALLIGVVLALRVLNAVALVSAVLGTAGLIGLVIGFAFRDMAENYIAGILLSLRQPFLPHDIVIIERIEGKVIRLTSRATVIMTYDGNHVRIPNATVFKSTIRNLTRNPQRRFDFTVGIGDEEDLTRAMKIGIEALGHMDGVLKDPPPEAWIDQLGDCSVTVHYFGWIDQRNTHFFKAKGEGIRIVKEALDAAGVEMPVPLREVTFVRKTREDETAPPLESLRPTVQQDISPDKNLDRQVAQDRAEEHAPDLLNTDGKKEG